MVLAGLGRGGAVLRAPRSPATRPSSYSILERERGKLGGNFGIRGVHAGEGLEGKEDGRQGERDELADVSRTTIALVFSSAPE